ncbi:hypothetical protein [Salmonella enterica]|uniref:hypothetical protein n=1 Tax=Salmonella enterica TaxID=28901 RepID=UPI0020CA4D0D|nr:hypothetical protein [Salmonella enterica]
MTIITREWLQQTIAEFENTRDDIPFGLDDDDAKILKVLKQVMASLDAKLIVPETLPCPVHLVPGLRLGKGCKTETLLIALQRRAEYYAGLDAMTPEERAKYDANIEAFKAMLPQPVPAASSESVSQSLTDALRDVIAERQRQVSVKGWTPEHDDTYTCGELSGAAISYIEPMEAVFYWPAEWHDDSFKPSNERRNLVKATALLLAEIERLDRISAASALSEVSDGKARED